MSKSDSLKNEMCIRDRLFINRNENVIGIIALGKRKSGYIFTDWASIEKIRCV